GSSQLVERGCSMNDLGEVDHVLSTNVVDSRDGDSAHVLIVEDDQLLLNTLCTFAKREGYSAQGVTNGAAALAEVQVRRPDIIVLDLALPVMDGYEFMERLTAQLGRGRPRVVVLSGT